MEVLAEGDERLALLFRQLRRLERLARHGLQRILGPGLSSTGAPSGRASSGGAVPIGVLKQHADKELAPTAGPTGTMPRCPWAEGAAAGCETLQVGAGPAWNQSMVQQLTRLGFCRRRSRKAAPTGLMQSATCRFRRHSATKNAHACVRPPRSPHARSGQRAPRDVTAWTRARHASA